MLSSLPMTRNSRTKTGTELSEEVQEAISFAKKASVKDGNATIQDRHLLAGLLRTNRLFTRLDALLKYSGAPHKTLCRLYREEAPRYRDDDSPAEATAIDKAIEISAMDSPSGGQSNPTAPIRVEIEHLLLAFTQSSDALVQKVLERAQLHESGIRRALPRLESESLRRFFLYILRETAEVILMVTLLVILIKQGLGEFRLIPSESMLPTLQVGDRIAVEKISHWYRKPQRGDILVFYPPEPQAILKHDPASLFLRLTGLSGIVYDKESILDRAFIKRVIGLPGDVIEVRPGDGVYINGSRLDEPYINEIANTCTFADYCGPIRVPEHTYYMMGDNRNRSADSRSWLFLPEERIIGRALFRFYPLDNRFGMLKGPSYPSQAD